MLQNFVLFFRCQNVKVIAKNTVTISNPYQRNEIKLFYKTKRDNPTAHSVGQSEDSGFWATKAS